MRGNSDQSQTSVDSFGQVAKEWTVLTKVQKSFGMHERQIHGEVIRSALCSEFMFCENKAILRELKRMWW